MLKIIDHPLAAHLLTKLRDKRTDAEEFRLATRQIGLLLAMEATRDLKLVDHPIETPLEPFAGKRLQEGVALVSVLRAGNGLIDPFTILFPDLSIGYIGLERDERSAIARRYYLKLPDFRSRRVFILDPMLATGGSARQAIELVREGGAGHISLVCVVAAPPGVSEVDGPDISIYTAALDRDLNERKFILPGLGDYGDRLAGE